MSRDAGDAASNESSRASGPNFAAMIKEIGGGAQSAHDLDAARAYALFAAILAGEVPALELGAILIALRIKGESLVETIAFMRALDAHVGHFEASAECPRPVLLPSYSGWRRSPNLTPLLALLLKRYGVPVLIHGPGEDDVIGLDDPDRHESHSPSDDPTFGRVTTLEILLELGVEPARNLADAQRRLTRHWITYVPTAVLAPGLAPLLSYRERLGVRSCAHSLAKLIDPFHGDGYRVVGVTHPECLPRMREFLTATHARALLLRGTEGEPFANPRRQLRIETFADGVGLCAENDTCSVTDIPVLPSAIDARTTAAWITRALAGSTPVPAPIIAQLACCLQGTRRTTAVT